MIDLTETHYHIVQAILSRYLPPHYRAWAFGSRVKGTTRQYSDLNLAIISKTPLDLTTLTLLENAFSDSDLPFIVDIVDWASCDRVFQQIIQQNYQEIPF
ncbi:nucleotidyltransferase domain-containing protein [Kingella negevensis]|uniref:Polymerase beta nucleotidyltransferase domain-containing protein n=1 Tax=Kingella negevensis TaxID=1522312 RepID=A0A238HJ04_9NEIS|nr:nucleotidyltransferase domain-containing protein [Kingella negevensis]MDK4684022.1 nucleotidyltransferase domain-containing protein [Kingella negevensis]MDK4698057.1 nucleotidyltransferase domain-containing protein [Kingella negevensis]MDK4707122.1 nucleotidyltransferase domain-containing protein [Kingella negevensis]MDK4710701.1 nucleotidyltransferase domain-containing protein [Kingella negevensis]SNB80843.1 Uncharacterised protein [Kingella negevensis]